jgi:DNA-binding NarL/FixJ family response regulator
MPDDCHAAGVIRSRRTVRVLVADDHPLTRLGIRVALGDGFDVCAEADDTESTLAAVRQERPDICVLDVGMPGNGIQAAARITAEFPEVAVVMISANDDDETLFAALRAGAVGYLPKEMSLTRLPEALLGVLDGEAAVPRHVTARLLGELRRPRRSHRLGYAGRSGDLTSRETDVLELLLDGLTTTEIGRQLFLAAPTVRSHVAAIMRKHAVRDRDALRALFDDPDRVSEGNGN